MPMDCFRSVSPKVVTSFWYTILDKPQKGERDVACMGSFDARFRNQWEFIDGFSLYSAAMLRPRWFDHLGKVGDLHTHSFCTLAASGHSQAMWVPHCPRKPLGCGKWSNPSKKWRDRNILRLSLFLALPVMR